MSGEREAVDGNLHWFAYAFSGNGGDGGQVWASVYIGYSDKNITMARMLDAKQGAEVESNAVLISVSYLGHMPKSAFAA